MIGRIPTDDSLRCNHFGDGPILIFLTALAQYLEQPENGIYIFSEDTEVGADAVELLGLHDVVFEYEITSNRVDCYSVVGIAREAAATFNKEFKPPVVSSEKM